MHVYYASQTRARVKKLKIELCTPKKDQTINTYLGIKKTVDTLAAIGSPISTDDNVEAILDGLTEEYGSFVTVVLSHIYPYTVEEIEALLLSQEEWLDKNKTAEQNHLQANLVSSPWPSHNNHNHKKSSAVLSTEVILLRTETLLQLKVTNFQDQRILTEVLEVFSLQGKIKKCNAKFVAR